MSATLVERTPDDVSAKVSAPEVGHPDAIEGYVPRRGARQKLADGSAGAKGGSLRSRKVVASAKAEKKVHQVFGSEKARKVDTRKIVPEREGADPTTSEVGTGLADTDEEWSRRLDESAAEAGISVSRYTEGGKESPVLGEAEATSASKQRLEVSSSGMTSEAGPSKRSAEERGSKVHGKSRECVVESDSMGANGSTDSGREPGQPGAETDLRLQSAQAVARALAEAAARVESGEVDATEAMEILGMTVQPANEGAPRGSRRGAHERTGGRLTEISELESEEGLVESGGVKRGLETGGVVERNESENGQSGQEPGRNAASTSGPSVTAEEDKGDDSGQGWMGAPPPGFSAELSQFGQLWTALDSWISADTLRFLHGTERFPGEGGVVCAGGKDYEPRVTLENGASAAIRRGFQECVRRALPDVQRAMQLKVARPGLEEALVRSRTR